MSCAEPPKPLPELMIAKQMALQVHAAINGGRMHPATPQRPVTIAKEAQAAVLAGSATVHVHAYGADGFETLDAQACAETIVAIREACPGIPISLSTSATIEEDPDLRLHLISQWFVLPDLVSANQGEHGIKELCLLLLSKGVEIEAGLLTSRDAEKFVNSGLAPLCKRVLVEPSNLDPCEACEHAALIEHILAKARIDLEQVHHGEGLASWSVNRRAVLRGHSIRTGLEDTTVLPDGRSADGNKALVEAAVSLIRECA